MSPAIEIDTLELEGMTAEEGRRAAKAFEKTLMHLLRQRGLPEGRTASDIRSVDIGELPRTMRTPEGVGQELARALFAELWR